VSARHGDVGQPHCPHPKPDGILAWCFGVVASIGATVLWLYALFGETA
jgi:hypothetical protein